MPGVMFLKISSLVLFLGAFSSYAYAEDYPNYTYKVRSGDTLSGITLMFAGTLNYMKVAKANKIVTPDLILLGKKIRLSAENPISLIDQYLEAIHENESAKAYERLSNYTKANLPPAEFERLIQERTSFDMNSFEVISDSLWNKHLVLFIRAQLEGDPASWGFNLIREKGKWRVLLLDHNPTFPQQLIGAPE